VKTIEAMYCVPREEPVVQLFVPATGGQWGEIRCRGGRLELELFALPGQQSWTVDAGELVDVIARAKEYLFSGQ
jgi:hypothetical protein